MYKRQAPPAPAQRCTLSAMHEAEALKYGDVDTPGASVRTPEIRPPENISVGRISGSSRSTVKLKEVTLPSADDAAETVEMRWEPHKPLAQAEPRFEPELSASKYVMKLTESAPEGGFSSSFHQTMTNLISGRENGIAVKSMPQPDPLAMSVEARKIYHEKQQHDDRPHFVTCFARMREFKTEYGEQHHQLMKDIETDDLLVKIRRLKRQELMQKARGQVLRDELREKMTTKMKQRFEESLLRKEPHAMWKLQKTMLEHSVAIRQDEQCVVPTVESFASPRDLSNKVVDEMRFLWSQCDNSSKIMARPHTAKVVRNLKSKVVESADDVFIASYPTSARLVSAKSRAIVASKKRCATARTSKYTSPWDLSAQEVMQQLDDVVRKTQNLEDEIDD
jgi:hypothetical protein